MLSFRNSIQKDGSINKIYAWIKLGVFINAGEINMSKDLKEAFSAREVDGGIVIMYANIFENAVDIVPES